MRVLPSLFILLLGQLLVPVPARAQQVADPEFKPVVDRPAWVDTHPLVVLDEAHANFHTASGRYKPFADVLQADGYRVAAGIEAFSPTSLQRARVLVVANAAGAGLSAATADDPPSAFTEEECDAVADWVRGGGSLLLIADHAPYGATAAALARRFGVEMGKGYAWSVAGGQDAAPSTTIVYSRRNGLDTSHSITRGVDRVVTFTGQSLGAPAGAIALLTFGRAAYESAGTDVPADLAAAREGKTITARNISGRAQGLALDFGQGRVVVMGEAAMLSAQVARFADDQGRPVEFRMGMNVPGNDNQRFLLNVMRWLTRLD
jgi:hypothetical protein